MQHHSCESVAETRGSLMQAALKPVSSSDKLELVDHLTDYVSDAVAQVINKVLLFALNGLEVVLSISMVSLQGSLADDELQYLFQAGQHSQNPLPCCQIPGQRHDL